MTPHIVALPGGFAVSDDRARLDMEAVHRGLEGAYWATGRRRDLTERAFAHSLALGAYAPDGATVGFGRLVTDAAFRAHLADFMVLAPARGRGLGRALVEAALGHPDLATVRWWTLTTADAHGLPALPEGHHRPGVSSAAGVVVSVSASLAIRSSEGLRFPRSMPET